MFAGDIITKINCWLKGEDKAFEVIYHYYQPRLCRYISKYLHNKTQSAEDIATDVLVRIWKKRYTIKADTFENYLFTIARNLLIREWRSNIDSLLSPEAIEEEMVKTEEDHFIGKELNKVYRQSLSNLSEQKRRIFLMHREESLTYKEIAEKLDISPKTVENQISAALKHLRASLSRYLTLVLFI